MAKYNYKANPNSPLGEPELSLSQGQKVSLLQKHASNDQWWKVRADDGSEGYVPATYVMVSDTKENNSKVYQQGKILMRYTIKKMWLNIQQSYVIEGKKGNEKKNQQQQK